MACSHDIELGVALFTFAMVIGLQEMAAITMAKVNKAIPSIDEATSKNNFGGIQVGCLVGCQSAL